MLRHCLFHVTLFHPSIYFFLCRPALCTPSTKQAKYKEVAGKDFGPPPKERKEKKQPQEQQAPSAKNAEKKAAKVSTFTIAHISFVYT